MLRINPDGSIPADNPFYDQTTGNNRAIWALGLPQPVHVRHPARHRPDVHQRRRAGDLWEEIDVGAAGANYGWPSAEGAEHRPARSVPPCTRSRTRDVAARSPAAAFYNPPAGAVPRRLHGDYFFADLDAPVDQADGRCRPATWPTSRRRSRASRRHRRRRRRQPATTSLRPIDATRPGGVTGFASPSTRCPEHRLAAAAAHGRGGPAATFSVVASGPEPLTYQWQRDGVDIPGANGADATRSPPRPPPTTARSSASIVSNALGQRHQQRRDAHRRRRRGARRRRSRSRRRRLFFGGGETISFAGTGSDPEDGMLPAAAFTWQVDYITGGVVRPLVPPTTGSRSGAFTIPTADAVHRGPTCRPRHADRDRLRRPDPHHEPRIAPAGRHGRPRVERARAKARGGRPADACPPFVRASSGFERLLGAPATQMVNGVTYKFVSWSDGGAAEHTINMPASNRPTPRLTAPRRRIGEPADPDLTVTCVHALPAAAVAGTSARARSAPHQRRPATPVGGASGVGLYLSADTYLHPDDRSSPRCRET